MEWGERGLGPLVVSIVILSEAKEAMHEDGLLHFVQDDN